MRVTPTLRKPVPENKNKLLTVATWRALGETFTFKIHILFQCFTIEYISIAVRKKKKFRKNIHKAFVPHQPPHPGLTL